MADPFQNSNLELGFLLFNVNHINGNLVMVTMKPPSFANEAQRTLIFKDISRVFLSSIVNSF